MNIITQAELVARIEATPGVVKLGCETITDARARKTGNPFGKIFKQSRFAGSCGEDYGKQVVREGERQGQVVSFESSGLPWGEWFVPGKIIVHNGRYYLRTQSTPKMRKSFVAKVKYLDEQGRLLTREQVKPFLPEKRESEKQQAAGLGETVHVRTFALDSIKRVRIGGRTYMVKG